MVKTDSAQEPLRSHQSTAHSLPSWDSYPFASHCLCFHFHSKSSPYFYLQFSVFSWGTLPPVCTCWHVWTHFWLSWFTGCTLRFRETSAIADFLSARDNPIGMISQCHCATIGKLRPKKQLLSSQFTLALARGDQPVGMAESNPGLSSCSEKQQLCWPHENLEQSAVWKQLWSGASLGSKVKSLELKTWGVLWESWLLHFFQTFLLPYLNSANIDSSNWCFGVSHCKLKQQSEVDFTGPDGIAPSC